jgi:hypothetical protein
VRRTRISRENRLIILVALAFAIPLLFIWALLAIPQEYWLVKVVILIIIVVAPAGFVCGYPGWKALNPGTGKK